MKQLKFSKEQTIKRLGALIKAGGTLREIAEKMNDDGYRNPKSGSLIKPGWIHYQSKNIKPVRPYKKSKPEMVEIVSANHSQGKIVAIVGSPEEVMRSIGLL